MIARLLWSGSRDLDLAALWRRGQHHGLIYYGEPGDRDVEPFLELLGDASGGGDENEETLLLARPEGMVIWLLCWDAAWVDSASAGPMEAELHIGDQRVSIDGIGNLAVMGVVDDGRFQAGPQLHTITGLQHLDTLEALLS